MSRGKSINLFLMDGDANGRIKCTLANWTGIAYKIPRTELNNCKDREDLKQSGVYFLFGNSDQTGNPGVYIGQAGARKNGEGILNRLQEHKRDSAKDYWTESIVFTTSNNSFGPTEISYLENRFYNLALATKRYEVKNENDPTLGHITEEKESELEEFIDYAKLIMGTLGHKIFIPFTQLESTNADISKDPASSVIPDAKFFLKRNIKESNITVKAEAKQTVEGFVVLTGSIIAPKDDQYILPSVREKRRNASINDSHILQEDVLFSSPTSAAQFVTGKSANGLTSWRTKDNTLLRDLVNEGIL